jgi:hypothetical protein
VCERGAALEKKNTVAQNPMKKESFMMIFMLNIIYGGCSYSALAHAVSPIWVCILYS